MSDDELPLTEARLKKLSGKSDLGTVTALTLKVDTRERSLGKLGDKLPKLNQLKLNNSTIPQIRDLGTSLHRLRILWLNQCGLKCLAGLGSLPLLKELYLAFNDISDLSPLAQVDSVEVLDLEANNINSFDEVYCLQPCQDLSELVLQGNPISNRSNYRRQINTILPTLEMLDDSPCVTHSSSKGLNKSSVDESVKTDNALVNESIRCSKAPMTATSASSQPLNKATPRSAQVKVYSVENTPRDMNAAQDDDDVYSGAAAGLDGTLMNTSTLFCGKPTKSLRARKAERMTPRGGMPAVV
eukprot:TRINITY_DN67623_c3_g8_i2.p1 TRINITY_DN67623_c3_g8~~TRINITY_DN67623_c3_g8_i2.p1  ORF type:complete len:299 (+),score=12.81 TRINITY_DN67623_c3_g8_i2:27-923(+)